MLQTRCARHQSAIGFLVRFTRLARPTSDLTLESLAERADLEYQLADGVREVHLMWILLR